jgi:hypothetical protein
MAAAKSLFPYSETSFFAPFSPFFRISCQISINRKGYHALYNKTMQKTGKRFNKKKIS